LLTSSLLTLLLASPAEPAPLRPLALGGPGWEGTTQFLATDRKGRPHLLRGGRLELYALGPGGLAERAEPLAAEGAGDRGSVLRAAASRDGSWLVMHGPQDLAWIRGGKLAPLPDLEWPVMAVGFCGEDPLLNVGPPLRWDDEPRPAGALVVTPSGDRWSPVLDAPEEPDDVSEGERRVLREMVFAPSTGSRFWAASAYAYRVRELTCGGRQLDELVVDGGKPRQHEGEAAAQMQAVFLRAVTEQLGGKLPPGAEAEVFLGRRVIQGLADGPDGRLYLVVDEGTTDAGLAVDRYDPGLGTLERVDLVLDHRGVLTVASGTDGLYLASVGGAGGRWYLPWSALDAADWHPVPGFEAAAPAPAAASPAGPSAPAPPG
jgi:hypothetical protein